MRPALRAVCSASRGRTDHRRAEEEARAAISLLEASLESTADGLLVVDRQGRIVRFNERFVRMWRIPAEVIESRDDDCALQFVLAQLAEPRPSWRR